MTEHCYSVYCHTTPSGRRYVGISKDPMRRWSNGNGYRENYLFYRAIQKYGWDRISHDILASELTIEEAKQMERDLISDWNLTNPEYGYNLREGGDGTFSEASIKKMSESRKGNTNCVGRILPEDVHNKISESLHIYYQAHDNPMKSRKHSEESLQKMRGRVMSAESIQKMKDNHYDCSGAKNPSARRVRQKTKEGETVKDYDYATVAANELSLDLSSIIKCCRRKHKSCGGYIWEYIS